MKYDLEQIHFRKWWITKNCREIIKDPFLLPTDEDYETYIREQIWWEETKSKFKPKVTNKEL